MKIIKTFAPPQSLKIYTVDPYEDREWILNRFVNANEIINKLIELKTVLTCSEWFDPQSFSRGTDYKIDGKSIRT